MPLEAPPQTLGGQAKERGEKLRRSSASEGNGGDRAGGNSRGSTGGTAKLMSFYQELSRQAALNSEKVIKPRSVTVLENEISKLEKRIRAGERT